MRISDWSSDVCSSDLVDLVQEQRAAMRAADAPRLADAAARAVDQVAAEQFGLGQFVRQRGAIDRGQRAAAAPALAVKHVRDQFLAGAGFALDPPVDIGLRARGYRPAPPPPPRAPAAQRARPLFPPRGGAAAV